VTFKDIVLACECDEMWTYMASQYDYNIDDDEKLLYLSVFNKLRAIEPKTNNLKLYIETTDSDGGCEVYGYNQEENTKYAIDFVPWSEWLGMEIDEAALSTYKAHEITAHALWEMTFISYDENEIQQEKDNACSMVEEVKTSLLERYAVAPKTK
jgi:hypothetical protein